MTIKLIPVGTPTVNNRLYPPGVIDDMLVKCAGRVKAGHMFCYEWDGKSAVEALALTVFYALVDRLFVADGWLKADITPLRPFSADVCYRFTICANAKISDDQTIYDCNLDCLLALSTPPKPQL